MKFQTLDFFRANDFMVVSEFHAAVMFNIGDIILANHLEIPIGKSRGFSSHGRKRIGLGGFEMDLTCICYQKNVIILMVTVTGWEGCNPREGVRCKHVFTHIDIQVNTDTEVFPRCLALVFFCMFVTGPVILKLWEPLWAPGEVSPQ